MDKVLIATTNIDKYDAVSKIFKKTIFPSNKYIILKLSDEMNIPFEKEFGSNINRAYTKAINAYDYLKKYDFDYIVGLDDAIVIKGIIQPNIRKYINKILFENYLSDGEEYAFNRAYCILDKAKNKYEINLSIPYIYNSLKEEITLKEYTYPLSKVSYPIGYNKPICDLDEEEEVSYYLKYVRDGLMSLKIKNNK